jgi:ubiquinone/menaquinone biosynthesis C-methylase UbiE
MEYSEPTKSAYEKYAKQYGESTKGMEYLLMGDIESFLYNLAGKKILDLGYGPGRDAICFQNKGFDVTCVDISTEMIKLCKEKGLKAFVMDFENLDF